MAVAVKNTPETARRPLWDRLAVSSLLGGVYILGSLGIVFFGIPSLWAALIAPWLTNAFVNVALLLVVMIATAAGLIVLGQRLVGPKPPPGLRAGVFFGALGILVLALLTCGIGILLETLIGMDNAALGMGLTSVVGLGLVVLGGSLFLRTGTERWLRRVEEQGWFQAESYKRGQGLRVRRGTILGLLVLVGCGIYTLLSHRVLEGGASHWGLRLPYLYVVAVEVVPAAQKLEVVEALQQIRGLSAESAADLMEHLPGTIQEYASSNQALRLQEQLQAAGATVSQDHQLVPLVPHVRYTVPLLLTLLTLWLAYRVVNFPPFADFLIATEAELNKVSWASRKRLVQDTVVVLTTVVLLTIFLFVVDLMWFKALSWINVIQTGTTSEKKEVGPQDW